MLDNFSAGFFLGILVGEGHFGGDGKQPQVVVKMHVRHKKLFAWIDNTVPGGRLYGPYRHGGRHYYQWMARGAFLRDTIVPLVLDRFELLDDHVKGRFLQMCNRYKISHPDNT